MGLRKDSVFNVDHLREYILFNVYLMDDITMNADLKEDRLINVDLWEDSLVNVDHHMEDILVSVDIETLGRTCWSMWISGRTDWSM